MKTTKTAILTIGAPGSGKSTFAQHEAKMIKNVTSVAPVILERDITREEICEQLGLLPENYNASHDNFHDVYYALPKDKIKEIEKEVTGQTNFAIQNTDGDIILSNTNLTANHRNALIRNLEQNGFYVTVKVFNPSLNDLLHYNQLRRNKVKNSVIFSMYQSLQHQLDEIMQLNDVILVTNHQYHNSYNNDVVICDLDGTIAHIKKSGSGKGHRTFFEMHKVKFDVFDDIVYTMVNSLVESYDADLVFFTGRNAHCFDQTVEWLDKNLEKYSDSDGMSRTLQNNGYKLYSRLLGDYRKDYEIKKELYDTFIDGRYEVLAVFDDRPQVVNLWHDMGLKVISLGDQRVDF